MADQEQETVSQQNPQESQVESLPQQQDIEISEQPQQSGLKSRWIDFKKAYMHAYLNIVSIPLKKDENKESVVDRIYRYSDFPLLTQVFPFFAYRALEKVFCTQIRIHYIHSDSMDSFSSAKLEFNTYCNTSTIFIFLVICTSQKKYSWTIFSYLISTRNNWEWNYVNLLVCLQFQQAVPWYSYLPIYNLTIADEQIPS